MDVITGGISRLKQSRPYRVYDRYAKANGNLLAAGVGYFAFFSVFPALALGFAVFGFVLQGRPELLQSIGDSLNTILPGMVKTDANPTGVIAIEAPQSLTLTITGIVAFVTLLYAGLGWVGALRTGIRSLFRLKAATGNFALTKARDLGVLVTLGVAIVLSAVVTSVVGGLAGTVATWIGLPGQGLLVGALGLVVALLFDTLIMVVLLRLLSGVALPWPAVRAGAIVGAVLLTVLKFFGARLITQAGSNPLLGAVAVSVGLLFWFNLMSRVVLLSAAWASHDLDVRQIAGVETPSDPVRGPRPRRERGPSPPPVRPIPCRCGLRTEPASPPARCSGRRGPSPPRPCAAAGADPRTRLGSR